MKRVSCNRLRTVSASAWDEKDELTSDFRPG
jgi:hypothetical protein